MGTFDWFWVVVDGFGYPITTFLKVLKHQIIFLNLSAANKFRFSSFLILECFGNKSY